MRIIETRVTARDFMEAAQDNPRAWRGINTEKGPGYVMIQRRPEPSTMIERASVFERVRGFISSIVKRPR